VRGCAQVLACARCFEIDANGRIGDVLQAHLAFLRAVTSIRQRCAWQTRYFMKTGCATCHHAQCLSPSVERPKAGTSFQLIWPIPDMLADDMGRSGDHRPEARATGTEWRTRRFVGMA